MKRTVLAIASVLAVGLVGAAPATAQSPPTLDGETLVALFSQCNNDPGNGGAELPGEPCTNEPHPATVEATCDEDGTSTLHYDFTADEPQTQGSLVFPNPAFGPYNGTFREDGTVTIAPQDGAVVPIDPSAGPFADVITSSLGFNTGALLTWTARFEIDAPAQNATIVGRKTLITELPNYGVCTELNNEPRPGAPVFAPPVTGWFYLADATLSYTATITTPDGVFRDYGTAVSDLREAFATYGPAGSAQLSADVAVMAEIFDSALPTPEPVSGDNCKKGGYLDFGDFDFKNQGDCVSFFATDGSNPPAG